MKSSIVKIAVIGSNSFSGASFVDFSLANNLSVMGISRSEQPNDIFLPYSSNTHKEEMSFGSEVNKFSLEPSDGIEDPLGVWLFGPWQRAASWLSALPAKRGAVFW